MKCGETGLVRFKGESAAAFKFRCKTWMCPHCARILRRRLIARAKEGRPDKLVTLTINPAMFDCPDAAACALVEAWRRARQQLKEFHGHENIEFLAVFEEHKSGWPHLHILCRSKFISQRWLSKYMRQRINSPIVDVRKIKSAKHAAIYVAKYIAKAPKRFLGCKRFWTSRHWQAPRAKPVKDPAVRWLIWGNCADILATFSRTLAQQFECEDATTEFMPPERLRRTMGVP